MDTDNTELNSLSAKVLAVFEVSNTLGAEYQRALLNEPGLRGIWLPPKLPLQ
jgi:hypothetical protein